MEITFRCPHCSQELAVDSAASGQAIQCPACQAEITVPAPEVGVHPLNPIASSAAAKETKHFAVPVHDTPAEILIKQPTHKEDEAAEGAKKVKIRIFRHSDCIEVGHDRYEEFVAQFLNKVGEENVISITPLNYTHIDIATQKLMTDYALQIIYRG